MNTFSRVFNKVKYLINIFNASVSAAYKLYKLRKALNLFKGSDVLILGSAPHPVLPHDYKNRLLICCNGSAAKAKQLQLSEPSMTVVDFELIDVDVTLSKDVRSVIINNQILKNLNLGYLVATQSNNAIGGAPELLNAKYDAFFSIDRLARRKIIDTVTGMNKMERDVKFSLCSTGGFSVALSLFLGVRSVSIAGFSHLFHGNKHPQMHFYDEVLESTSNELNTRNHSMADSALIALSCINGYKINSLEPDILPLVQNWGNNG
jgi:hypothetical protein